MKFGSSFWLFALPILLVALVTLWTWSARRAREALKAVFDSPLLSRLVRSVNPQRRLMKKLLLALGIASLAFALARPQWGRAEVEVERTGVDLVIALDISRSMLAVDAGGTNRLATAIKTIERLLKEIGGDRVAVVAFAGEPYMLAPLTRDHVAVYRSLTFAAPAIISEQGSDLGKAIKRSVECFERGAVGTRALLVVSDGEQLQGDAVEAARSASREGIKVHTAGVGSAIGNRVPTRAMQSGSYLRNQLGREVVSRRDEHNLLRISKAGGGLYTRIDEPDSTVLAEWFQRVAITLPRSTEKKLLDEPQEGFQWPLAFALAILALEWLLGDRRRDLSRIKPPNHLKARQSQSKKRSAALAGLGVFICAMVSVYANETPWDHYNQGVRAYAESNFEAALERWHGLSLQKLPHSLERMVWFQLGNAQFRLGEPLEQTSPEEAAEHWRRSCGAYHSALQVKPRDREVRHNLGLVEGRLATLAHRLGMDAFRVAQDKPIDDSINLFQTSIEWLGEAVKLAPNDGLITEDHERAAAALVDRLKERALAAENKADDFVRQDNDWADQQAEEEYRAALDDLAQARSSFEQKSTDTTIRQAETRVQQKLADLLTRRGQREQSQGKEQDQANPDEALGHYETALDLYRAAQEAQPGHTNAQAGERAVRERIEKLHVREGRAALERGKSALALQSTQAAPALLRALSHFEAALRLNENNLDARSGAEEARRLLPEALTLAGQAELRAGDRAESRSVSEALSHYQEAEQDFRQSLELKPNQPLAEKGLREAEEKAARARQRAAEEAENIAKASQPQNRPPKTLDSLLGQVEEKERSAEFDRERQRAQRITQPRKYRADW